MFKHSALFEKFVGVDPLSAEIFEHPAIKKRMQKLLGDKYDSTMILLNTASEIQKEGNVSEFKPATYLLITGGMDDSGEDLPEIKQKIIREVFSNKIKRKTSKV